MKKHMMAALALMTPLFCSSLQAAQTQAGNPGPAAKPPGEVTFYVTRHGKTMFNTAHRMQGWSDTPLTAAGVEVATALGRGVDILPALWLRQPLRGKDGASC